MLEDKYQIPVGIKQMLGLGLFVLLIYPFWNASTLQV